MVKQTNDVINEDFSEICTELGQEFGIDALPCKIFAILYLENSEISLEDIANKTGFSLSTVSKAMTSLERLLCLKKFRKPKSKKKYFLMEKDMHKFTILMMKKKLQGLAPLREGLPIIIKKYEHSKDEQDLEKIKLIKSLNKNVVFMEKALRIVLKLKGE